jgi:hypothetical protein
VVANRREQATRRPGSTRSAVIIDKMVVPPGAAGYNLMIMRLRPCANCNRAVWTVSREPVGEKRSRGLKNRDYLNHPDRKLPETLPRDVAARYDMRAATHSRSAEYGGDGPIP